MIDLAVCVTGAMIDVTTADGTLAAADSASTTITILLKKINHSFDPKLLGRKTFYDQQQQIGQTAFNFQYNPSGKLCQRQDVLFTPNNATVLTFTTNPLTTCTIQKDGLQIMNSANASEAKAQLAMLDDRPKKYQLNNVQSFSQRDMYTNQISYAFSGLAAATDIFVGHQCII